MRSQVLVDNCVMLWDFGVILGTLDRLIHRTKAVFRRVTSFRSIEVVAAEPCAIDGVEIAALRALYFRP